MFSDTLAIEGKDFSLVKIQRDEKSAIYHSDGVYLRIGETDRIQRDLAFHKKMETFGFPVASYISEGVHDNFYYFTETSLGEINFTHVFAEDVEKQGSISDESFADFTKIIERFAEAQLKTQTITGDSTAFAKAILLPDLCNELPEYKTALQARFEKVVERTTALPWVITHGDCNSHNIHKGGIIDLEDSFTGPFGYDLITALVHINYFPDPPATAFLAKYRFTLKQQEMYLSFLDEISTRAHLPPLSLFKDDFEFCRAVWLAARLDKYPELQKFRFDLLIEKFL
jgi:hypothetical protein